MNRHARRLQSWPTLPLVASLLLLLSASTLRAQDTFHLETSSGATSIRLAAANFKSAAPAADAYKHTFDAVLFSDLTSAGIFDVVSKSLLPQTTPGSPAEINLPQWSQAPASAAMVAFGNLAVQGTNLVVNGFLDDAKNTQYPQVFAKQYLGAATDDTARQLAHQFADDIIFRLSGGTPGIAESKIFYSKHTSPGVKEIWMMDYDGANQHAVTHLGEDSISPRVSPDNSLLAFSSLGHDGFQIRMFSLLLGRLVRFNSVGGTNLSPAWSPSGQQLAFSSSRTGDPEIWVSDPQGAVAHRITNYKGPDVSPTWNPKTGAQIAWISGRTGLPQLYIMDSDGSGVTRMTDGGYATSPSWSPNAQFITFAWDRHYGPGAPGGQDIYIMDIASKRWVQLTHDAGSNDFPSWSPDGRHIVFERQIGGRTQIWSMLADGTEQHQLTHTGNNYMPNWSWK